MTRLKDAATDFLASRRIAVTGVSRNPQGHGGNAVYKRLRDRGYQVFAVNPNADTVEGDACYHALGTIPGGVDAVVICTKPSMAKGTLEECVDLGIKKVWMHRAFGAGSFSPEAAEYGRNNGLTVISGGCPLMFDPAGDGFHRGMRFVCTLMGTAPSQV